MVDDTEVEGVVSGVYGSAHLSFPNYDLRSLPRPIPRGPPLALDWVGSRRVGMSGICLYCTIMIQKFYSDMRITDYCSDGRMACRRPEIYSNKAVANCLDKGVPSHRRDSRSNIGEGQVSRVFYFRLHSAI